MTRIKIDPADKYFSYYIRLKQNECQRCHSLVVVNLETRMPRSHTVSHYFGRSRESVRFDIQNVDTLCMGCHRIWSSDDKEGYRNFMIKKLGQRGFDSLTIRANLYHKKDRKMELIKAKLLLKSVML